MPHTSGNAAPGGLASDRAARVAVAARSERGAAHEHVRLVLCQPVEQPFKGVLLVLAEVVVAAGERVGDSRCRARGPDRPRPSMRVGGVLRGLLAAEPGEELVEVVDDLHHDTACSRMSPIWQMAPR